MKKVWKKPVIEKLKIKKITLTGSGRHAENHGQQVRTRYI